MRLFLLSLCLITLLGSLLGKDEDVSVASRTKRGGERNIFFFE